MKMKSAQKVSYDSGPNMTPLVDVVMVILIFLMMVGQFGNPEHYLMSNVPLLSDTGATQNEKTLTDIKTTIEISVDSLPAGGFSAKIIGRPAAGQSLDEALRMMLEGLKRSPQPALVDNIQVIIAPQQNVRWAHLVKVYDSTLLAFKRTYENELKELAKQGKGAKITFRQLQVR